MVSEKASPATSDIPPPSPGTATCSPPEPSASEPADDCSWLRRDLVRAVRHYCPGWLSDISEDLVQTAVIRVLEARRKANDSRPITSAYLYKAAYSVMVNEIRKRRVRKEVPMDDELRPLGETAWSSTPERSLSARELGGAIVRCLGKLLRDRKIAVTLHLQGYTIEEAARLLKSDRKRTENLIYRGLTDLRDCLSSQGITP